MLSNPEQLPLYRRESFDTLRARLVESRRFITVIAGPRQVGKTTLIRQVAASLNTPVHLVSADDPGLRDRAWLEAQWQVGRTLARTSEHSAAVLVLDEAQKIPTWSEIVKRLWDEDTAASTDLRVVVLGSAPVLVQRGLTESLAGRFEVIRLAHWSLPEMRDAFGWDLDTYLFFGGYPGAASLIGDIDRWRAYMLDSLIETTLSRDILLLTRVDKPALLRQLFRLGADYSGQILSYQKLVGQLQDAGNTTTLAHYLELLQASGLLAGLQKYAGSKVRQRGSSPKLLLLDPGLMTAMSEHDPVSARGDADFWGRLVETAVGAHLMNTAGRDTAISWWREGDHEVDYVVSDRTRVLAIEVASGRRKPSLPGLAAFGRVVESRKLLVGAQGLPLDVALATSGDRLLKQAV